MPSLQRSFIHLPSNTSLTGTGLLSLGALAFTAVVLVACVGVDIFQILYTRKKRFYIRSEGNREKLKMCYQCLVSG